MIDAGAITLIQTTFLQKITAVFDVVIGYSLDLLYIFAGFELAVFGLLWAFGQGAWERFFFKVLKIGLIFFIIQNYTYLVDIIIRSLVQVGGFVASTKELSNFIFNPAILWQYGYDHGLMLLKMAAANSSVGMAMILLTLGMGILLVFGLLGIQIILQVVGFYLVSLAALIFLPFSTFNPAQGMFDGAVRSVLKAAVRVMVLIMVIGVAVTVWSSLNLTVNISSTLPTDYNISEPLGLFFTALLFLYLAMKLPYLASEVVGSITMRLNENELTAQVSVAHETHVQTAAAASNLQSVQTASTIEPGASSIGASASAGSTITGLGGMIPTPAVSSGALQELWRGSESGKDLSRASSISDRTLKKIEKTLVNVLKQTSREKTNS